MDSVMTAATSPVPTNGALPGVGWRSGVVQTTATGARRPNFFQNRHTFRMGIQTGRELHNSLASRTLNQRDSITKITGVTYYQYRYYDPLNGRWPSRDPIGIRGGYNLYVFLGDNGVGRIDVLGRDPFYGPTIPHFGVIQSPSPTCADKIKAMNEYMEEIIKMNSSKKAPDCSGTDCEIVRIIIDLGYPCSSDLGHTGVTVGDRFYDIGFFDNLTHWSGLDQDGNNWMSYHDLTVKDVRGNSTIKTAAQGAGQLEMSFCGCKKTYENIENVYKVYTSYLEHCTSISCLALNVNNGWTLLDVITTPRELARKIGAGEFKLKSECGQNKGDNAYIKILNRAEIQ